MNKEKIRERLEELDQEKLGLIAQLNTPEDVTAECEAVIGKDSAGAIRLYLVHKGEVILRAGLGKVPSLTSYAESHDYKVEEGWMGARGAYFKVFKN